jgi:hypothetical protein
VTHAPAGHVAPVGHPTSIHEQEDLASPWQDAAVVCVEQRSLTAIAGIRFDELVIGVESDD